jgi:hypothetical protein
MEEEKQEEVESPRMRRRVSLFKRRKKSDIRPFVRETKHRQYKKLFGIFLLALILIFSFSAVLLGVKSFVLPKIFSKEKLILNPQGSSFLDNSQIQDIIQTSGLEISDIRFSTSSAIVSFVLHNKVQVFISSEKDINNQLDLVGAIDRQLVTDGKQAISIDLRYNKPIVKF